MQDPSEHYAAANRHFVAAVCRVADHRARVERLRLGGHPTKEAENLLDIFERTLAIMGDHQRQVSAEMAEWLSRHRNSVGTLQT